METHERTQRLRTLMRKHKLSAADVGRMLDRTPQTVRNWACANPDRVIPKTDLRLLELECATIATSPTATQ